MLAGRPASVGDYPVWARGLALGVLMDTFIVRTVLVPCTVILLRRWNWWPSRLSRVEIPEVGGERDIEPVTARE